MPRPTQPRTELLPHTQVRLWERWPNMTDAQRNRFALIAQEYRELKGELDAQELQLALDNDVTVVEPYLADMGCAAARCAALGEPATGDDGASIKGPGREEMA